MLRRSFFVETYETAQKAQFPIDKVGIKIYSRIIRFDRDEGSASTVPALLTPEKSRRARHFL